MILAFELSSRRGSIALHDGTTVVAERTWEDAAARHGALWPELDALVKSTGLHWPALTALAVGRGPGSFSGQRAAITAARVLAAPDRHRVLAVSSGEALAREWFAAHPGSGGALIVAGDARRGSIWHGHLERHGACVRLSGDWSLASGADFLAHIPHGAPLVTSDRARLEAALAGKTGDVPEIHECFPTARAVAAVAWSRLRADIASDPIEPLYLHPPVA